MQTLVFNKAGRQPNSQTLKQPQKLSKAGSSNEVPFLQRKKRRKDTTERAHGSWGERPAEIDFLQVKDMLSGTETIPCFERQELRGPGAGTTWETTQSSYVRLTDAHLCWRERERGQMTSPRTLNHGQRQPVRNADWAPLLHKHPANSQSPKTSPI